MDMAPIILIATPILLPLSLIHISLCVSYKIVCNCLVVRRGSFSGVLFFCSKQQSLSLIHICYETREPLIIIFRHPAI